jgi:hypothetical protein
VSNFIREISGALAATGRFLPGAWRRAPGALLAAGVLLGLAFDPAAPGHWLLVLAAAAALLVAQGSLYRLALDRRLGPLGLQWGAPETRLLAVALLKLALLGVLGALAFVVVLCVGYGVASAGPGFIASDPTTWAEGVDARGQGLVTGVTLLCLAGLGWVILRVSLAAAATVARDRVEVLTAFGLTKGRVAAILAGLAAIGAPAALLLLALGALRTAAVAAAPQLAASLALGFVFVGLFLPLNVGLMTYLYGQPGPVTHPPR